MRNVVSNPIEGRLAASQPDREAAECGADEWHISRSNSLFVLYDVFCGTEPIVKYFAKRDALRIVESHNNSLLSLLSGAGTKSDGGNERVVAVPPEIPTQRSGESRDPLGDGSVKVGPHREDAAGIKPGPVKPAPIADSSEAGTGGDLAALAKQTLRKVRAYPGTVYAREAVERFIDAALSAPVGEPVAWQFMASDDVVLSTTADKRVVKQWEQSGYHVRPLYTHPPTPAVGGEDVARIIDRCSVEFAPNCSGILATQIEYARRDIKKAVAMLAVRLLSKSPAEGGESE